MHWAYACAFSRAVVAFAVLLGDDPPVGSAVVVGPAPARGTVGDLDPLEQAPTANESATAVAAHRRGERTRAAWVGVMQQASHPLCCHRVWGFRYARDMRRSANGCA